VLVVSNVKLSIPLIDNKGMLSVRHASCHLDCDIYQKLLFSMSIYLVSAINVAKILRCLAYKN